jgi:uncharacterized protein involved in exopolysaccharide biosynthesis
MSSQSQTSSGPSPSVGRAVAPQLRGRLGSDEGSSELSRYLGVLWERRWAVVLMLVLWPTLAALWTKSQPRIYETRASILVEASVPQVLGSAVQDVVDPTPANYYLMQDFLQTSRKVLTSDSLARRVAARLKLTTVPGFYPGGKLPQSLDEAR